ncbi:contractile injection system tape measure protein [Photorhabdus tasmaniensis]|uniref:contractile injection system tape measure protein n=1 Tax=Photorhabdus tasmaniensis TaxID=1004159 RepID=UPI0040425866
MTSEPNLLNRITITIEANNQQVAKKVLHGSLLNQANINNLFNTFFTQRSINQDIYLETLTLDLGEISLHDFNSLFPIRLNSALNKALSQYQINNKEEIRLNAPMLNKITHNPSLSGDNNFIDAENFIHALYQKAPQLNPAEAISNNKNSDIKIKQLINQLTRIENKSALLLAKSCLSEHSLQQLLAIKQPALLSAINHRLSERVNKPHHQEAITTSGQLILNALEYIQRHNAQEILKPDAKIISRITTELSNGTLNAASVITLFRQTMTHNIPLNNWLKQLWQTAAVSRLCQKHLSVEEHQYLLECFIPNHTGKNRSEIKPFMSSANSSSVQKYQHSINQKVTDKDRQALSISDNPSVIRANNHNPLQTINKPHAEQTLLPEHPLPRPVNNAGILILWPMLPALFNQLGLLEAQKFIHRQAQFNAIDLLDYLIWGTEEKPTERKALNYVLCGLMADKDIQSIPIEPEKQLLADQWLDAVISQLPGWKKLSRNDVRQLFLQRPGELLADEQAIKITIQHQPFDALLADWPWPLNIAKLPWLDRPLRIDWQNI